MEQGHREAGAGAKGMMLRFYGNSFRNLAGLI